jgi:penicillin-binding protein 1A
MSKILKYRANSRIGAMLIGLMILGMVVIIGIVVARTMGRDLPSLAKLHDIQPSLITHVYDRNGTLIKEFYNERRMLIPYNKIPPYLIDCLLATEDRKFYSHWGVDLERIVGATVHNLTRLSLTREGASTLTQQLARNLFPTVLAPSERSYTRKIREALTAIKIERTYSKNEILQMYLNQNYYGRGAYGIQAAAQVYFSKDAWDLTLSDCAVLVGLLKAPNRYSPIEHPDRAIMRRNIVFNSLVEYGKLSEQEADSLKKLPLEVDPNQSDFGKAPYFTELIRQYLLETYGEEALYSSGMSIYTTLDANMQRAAENALFAKVDELQRQTEANHRADNPDYTMLIPDSTGQGGARRVYKQIQGALMAVDNETGGVLAFIGGRDFNTSKFIRVTQALRQPGSSFKPFVYTTAIDNGFSPSDQLLDSPIVLTIGGKEWRPDNFDLTFKGEITLRDALKESRNLVAIKLIMDPLVTPQQVVDYAHRMGISTPLNPVPSLAIGSSEVTMWDMVPAFSVFPNGGVRKAPFYITKIVDRNGNVKFEKTRTDQEEVLSPQTAYIMTNMLQTVVDHGTGAASRSLGFTRPAGGKTGTSNDNTDNWFIGFTPQITCGVWIGFDDKTKIGIGRGEVGSTTALPIWANFMKSATADMPAKDFPVPPGIYTTTICLDSGKLAREDCPRTLTDIFTEATLPKEECTLNHNSSRSANDNSNRFRLDEIGQGKKGRF